MTTNKVKTDGTVDAHSWPRNTVNTIETRKRDIVIRIADWTRQSQRTGEPAYDVEVYEHGIYDWHKSESFCLREMSKVEARRRAVKFAQEAIAKAMEAKS